MQFTSIIFIFFFLLTLMLVRMVPGSFKKYILIIANIIFYLSNGPIGGLILFGVAVISYGFARFAEGKKVSNILIPFISIGITVLMLVMHMTGIYYSLGFSFYTLMAVGYIIDVCLGKGPAIKSFSDYFLCLSFFPIIQSGPIENIQQLSAKINSIGTSEHEDDKYHFLLILWGLIEKLSFADIAGIIVKEMFDNYKEHSLPAIALATVLFAFQLYADFDGYSNMAYGMAGLLGIKITRNFTQPYLADSVQDFWRRWHRSLSTWLKDYVYIPLGGNRKGKIRKYINVIVTFMVSGIWHGTGLNFLVWGMLHGVYQVAENLISTKDKKTSGFVKAIKILITFILVDFAWFFFRVGSLSDAAAIFAKVAGGNDFGGLIAEFTAAGVGMIEAAYMVCAIVVLIVTDLLRNKGFDLFALYNKIPRIIRWGLCYGLIFWIIFAALVTLNTDMSGFIYGQF